MTDQIGHASAGDERPPNPHPRRDLRDDEDVLAFEAGPVGQVPITPFGATPRETSPRKMSPIDLARKIRPPSVAAVESKGGE